MFELVPLKREHIEYLATESINSYLSKMIADGAARDLEKTMAFTAMLKGEIAGCGGIAHVWEGRGTLWAIFSEASKQNHVPVYRGIQKFLDQAPYTRIEMAVPYHLAVGHRRAKMLGFELECKRAKKYLMDGTDCALYARVRGN